MEQVSESTIDADERRRIIRQKRQQLGLTQIELARRAGVDLSTLNWFENGRHHIKPSTLAKIEEALAAAEGDARTIERLHAPASQADLMLGMLADARSGGANLLTSGGSGWRSDSSLPSNDFIRELGELRESNARLSKQVEMLEKMNAMRQQQIESYQQQIETYQKLAEMDEEEAVITAAAIAALEKSLPQKSPEAKSLLRYRKMLLAR